MKKYTAKIIRHYGPNADYLIGFDARGTPLWGGNANTGGGAWGALNFPEQSAAHAAIRKARRNYIGWNSTKCRYARQRPPKITLD